MNLVLVQFFVEKCTVITPCLVFDMVYTLETSCEGHKKLT